MRKREQAKDDLTCHAPDRHNPKLVCGYPLPCPHHSVLILIENDSKPKRKRAKKGAKR